MTTSLIEADSLLTIDVGSVNTRAALFDVVDSRYRFLGSGVALTTAYAPFHDLNEGIRRAIDQLQEVTGRVLLGLDKRLIIPARDGSGVDTFSATLSAGPTLKVVVVGLLEDLSLESAQRLARTVYSRVVDSIGLNDRRRLDARIDAIIRHRPDLVIVAGGTENGASVAVLKMLEMVGLASYLLPSQLRPEVLYAGNQSIKSEIKSSFERMGGITIAPNLRPVLDVEQVEPALSKLTSVYRRIRGRQLTGARELDTMTSGELLPTSIGLGRVVRFLSKIYDPAKGVMGVDLGASAATLALAFNGELDLHVYPQFGLGEGLADLRSYCSLPEIARWLPAEVATDVLRDYLFTKALRPVCVPVTLEELAIEQALARQLLRAALDQLTSKFKPEKLRYGAGLLPWLEPIVVSGSVFTRAPKLSQALLMLLDGLQPTGITTLVLDQYHIASALGAAAAINPILAVQVLESSAFTNLGTVISPIGDERYGTTIMHGKIIYNEGNETRFEAKQGSIELLPLPTGQTARLQLQPLHRYEVGMGAEGRGGRLKVVGGVFGVVIDARGRPLNLPEDAGRRWDLLMKWSAALTG